MLMFPALVLPLMDRYGMDLSHVLALSFWMYLLFGLTALPWGLLSDRLGARPLLLVFYAGAGLCGLAAGYFVDSPGAFSLCLAGLGLFSGIYHPAGLGLISRGIGRMSVALGYNGMAGNAGLAAAPILAGIINHFYGIRAAFLFLACLNLLGTVIMLFLPIIEPKVNQKTESRGSKRLLLGFAILCICMMLGGIAYRSVTVILPSYFELRNPALLDWLGGLAWMPASRNVAATALSSLVFLVGMLGQFLGGFAAERFEPRRAYLVFHLFALPMALAMAYATDVPLLFITMGYMLFLLGMQPIENTLVAYFTPDQLRHSAFGTKFVLTFGVGAAAVHLVGWIKEVWSLPAVFVALTGVSLSIVLSILTLIMVTRKVRVGK
ncbi:MAG: MFS transporter [Proteobacteria bacterium]|nr:MFS transporter [Desulfobacterales bacterium]MBL6967001.1 MFS transporter [Desulfobacteraceae bacterium]MBU0734797.1 MFS transporter [Pseudomonadota bacterium]MBL7101783.1 MFS transporter [Desulfobacteraceae bacterium]MBL7172708.1 MFS transporter [Desulfobacteraceae bacterium]